VWLVLVLPSGTIALRKYDLPMKESVVPVFVS